RHSVIRWVADPTQNAMGPHVHDPRSGEIISAHIIFWHDIVKLVQLWYFVQCGGSDSRVTRLPLSDEIIGDCLRYVSCHEVGHTLGLRHNHRASQAFSVAQLRDPKFTDRYGTVSSIMSYGRFNYVAQPGDNVKSLIPIVGPYDHFAIEWGYKSVPGAKTADDEKKTLDEWAAQQIDNPFLRFGGEDGPAAADPTVLTQNIGSDPVEATALGLKNLDRTTDYLLAATTEKGEDYALLRDAYRSVIDHRRYWFGAVSKQVGGVVENRTLGGRGDETFVRVPREKQKEAVKFLLDNAFTTPTKLLNPKVVNQFRYEGVANDLATQQRDLLQDLLSVDRLNRLFDAELLAPDKAYTAVELVGDVQDGLFSELKADAPKVDPLRRQLQRSYVDILRREFESAVPQPTIRIPGSDEPVYPRVSELRAVARMSLRKLEKQIGDTLAKVKDPATRAHLEDTLAEVRLILDEKKK
ncbi:MAG TPA: zinc-dependent metalloprotease, partial [Gemmataceae bacterium]|nr:zinc-dependent metalloprotease [Gemmataceae bacterium]